MDVSLLVTGPPPDLACQPRPCSGADVHRGKGRMGPAHTHLPRSRGCEASSGQGFEKDVQVQSPWGPRGPWPAAAAAVRMCQPVPEGRRRPAGNGLCGERLVQKGSGDSGVWSPRCWPNSGRLCSLLGWSTPQSLSSQCLRTVGRSLPPISAACWEWGSPVGRPHVLTSERTRDQQKLIITARLTGFRFARTSALRAFP